MAQVSIVFKSKGHSLKACFFRHLGQKMDNATFLDICLFCILRVSFYSLRLPKISVLKVSIKLPNSSLLTIPNADLLILDKGGSLGLFPTHALPLEICKHNGN